MSVKENRYLVFCQKVFDGSPHSPQPQALPRPLLNPHPPTPDSHTQELERLFPTEIAADGSKAVVRKSVVVKTPLSVYTALAGCQQYR